VPGDVKPVEPADIGIATILSCFSRGKSIFQVEFPDHYETWIKCSSCGFFMGMSNEAWHRMENSPNIITSIKKMVIEKKTIGRLGYRSRKIHTKADGYTL